MTRQDCAACRFEPPLLRHVCLAHGIIQLSRFGELPIRQETFRAEDAAFRDGGHGLLACARERLVENLGRLRSADLSEGGGCVVFGSDWPVATIDAMGRVTHIVNRGPRTGGTDQRLSMTSAIDRYTSGPAYASFDEKEKGTIAPGMLADIVVIATDVFANPPASRADIAVQTTVFDGRIVYRAAAR